MSGAHIRKEPIVYMLVMTNHISTPLYINQKHHYILDHYRFSYVMYFYEKLKNLFKQLSTISEVVVTIAIAISARSALHHR